MSFIRCIPLLLLPFALHAQDTSGIQFEHAAGWSAILAKAKAENKYIFMDCFTTWCGPCKFMSEHIFPLAESGAYFNPKFISVKVQLDTTAKDDDHVKGWYADAHALMMKYGIHAFPTYLVFTPDGKAVHRLVGSRLDAKTFIADIGEALDTSYQYYTQLEEFDHGRRDSAFLRRLVWACVSVYDKEHARDVAKAWFATQSDLYTPDGIKLMSQLTHSSKDPGFDLFLHHAAEADKVMSAGFAERTVSDILMDEDVIPKFATGGSFGPDWKEIERDLAKSYPAQAGEVTGRGKVLYYAAKKDWPHFEMTIVAFMQKYGASALPSDLNDYAWTVFQNCPDMTCVADALDWSKRSFKDQQIPAYMDTYANILYKLGRKDEAITWEQKAMDLASAGEKADFQATIDKMKKGEKTWN
jgi:thiol-disulfide isomerase/thioredoxin